GDQVRGRLDPRGMSSEAGEQDESDEADKVAGPRGQPCACHTEAVRSASVGDFMHPPESHVPESTATENPSFSGFAFCGSRIVSKKRALGGHLTAVTIRPSIFRSEKRPLSRPWQVCEREAN